MLSISGAVVGWTAVEIFRAVKVHREWKRKHEERMRIAKFWSDQCDRSLEALRATIKSDPDEWCRAYQAHRVNVNRFERDVLGGK